MYLFVYKKWRLKLYGINKERLGRIERKYIVVSLFLIIYIKYCKIIEFKLRKVKEWKC